MDMVPSFKILLSYLRNNPLKTVSGIYHQAGMNINVWMHRNLKDPKGIKVMDQDWDNLIILDGCRYDLYQEVRGRVECRRSLGSSSWEFLRRNFNNKEYHDTIYVTANPFAPKLDPDTFFKYHTLLEDGWNPDSKTIEPYKITNTAVDIWKSNPQKRLIVHFMQPHYPFIGPTGQQIPQGGLTDNDTDASCLDSKTIWTKLQFGIDDIDKKVVWKAYKENLELVLEDAIRLHENIDGKTVITADHGNLVGDRVGPIPVKGYAHPSDLYVPELVEVPWETLSGERREITKGSPQNNKSIEQEVVKDRLKQLGYHS